MSNRWLPLTGVTILVLLFLLGPAPLWSATLNLSSPPPKISAVALPCERFNLIATPGPAPGTVGRSYGYQIKTSNPKISPAYKVVEGQLPFGLKADAKGLIQGVPQKEGTFHFTIQAEHNCGGLASRATQKISITIQPRPRVIKPVLSITCRPSTLSVIDGKEPVHLITYLFTGSGKALQSSEGRFMVNNTVVGKVAQPITATLKQPSGQAVESLTIPKEVIQAAQKLRTRQMTYVRDFNVANQKISARATIHITIAPQPDPEIQALALLFGDKTRLPPIKQRATIKTTAKTTIKAGQMPPPLTAYITLSQPGVFEAYWQINGKPVSATLAYKSSGKPMTVAYPHKTAPLDKLPEGEHHIQFIIQTPRMKTPAPTAVLVVQADNRRKPAAINLRQPENKSKLEYQAVTFNWSGPDTRADCTIEFGTLKDATTVFSDACQQDNYHLTGEVVKNRFTTGIAYTWQVKHRNAQKRVIAQSPTLQFVFKPPPTFQAGQIVVITQATPGGRITLSRLSKTYQLKTIETIAIRTLKQTATVFGTQGDVTTLIRRISKERGVLKVQPNHLFRTMAEPQNDLQQIVATLNLPMVHQHYQGKGVRVAIVDTGVDIRHPDLQQRVIQHANLIRNNPYRAEIHGTALAGVMAASINHFGITGIAPQAELIALRACWQTSESDPEGTCTTISISKAIDLAIESHAQIVNMSFGASAPDPLMMQLLDAGAKSGVLFVAPVGNQADRTELPFPASHSKVLSVGGWDSAGAPYPNADLAGAADLCAPASNIFTTVPGNGHNFLSGTSISAAIVSGILAIAKEKNRYLSKQTLPAFDGDICRWQEKLINRSVCNVKVE